MVKYFHKEFADALSIADKAYVMDIGEDRKETGYDDVSAYDIIKDIKDINISDNINIVVKTGKINANVKGVSNNERKERNEI